MQAIALVDAKLKARALARALIARSDFSGIDRASAWSVGIPWTEIEGWGIAAEAWRIVEDKVICPYSVFCHPRLIEQQPPLMAYYRGLARISRQELETLSGVDLALAESLSIELRPRSLWIQIAKSINALLSEVVLIAGGTDIRIVEGLRFAAAGRWIDRDLPSQFDVECQGAVRAVLLNSLKGKIVHVVWKDTQFDDYLPNRHAEVLDRVRDIKLLRLKSGHQLHFGSEPDVSLHDPAGLPVLAIEVKAGNDKAGALERLGASMKSFENDRNQNPRIKTVYVVRCMTPELRRRIDETHAIDHTFSLAEMLANDKTQRTFANLIVRIVVGKSRG